MPREPEQRGLRGIVRGEPGAGLESGRRPDEHERTILFEQGHGGPRYEEVRPHVHREDVVPQLGCRAFEPLALSVPHVGHHAIEATKILVGLLDESCARRGVADVGDDGDRGGAFLRAQVGGEAGGLFVDVDACHPGTFASAQHGDRTSIADRHFRIR